MAGAVFGDFGLNCRAGIIRLFQARFFLAAYTCYMLSLNNGTSAAFNAIKWCQRFIYVMRIDHDFFRGRRIAVPLFVAGAIFREIWVDSWSAKHFFYIQNALRRREK